MINKLSNKNIGVSKNISSKFSGIESFKNFSSPIRGKNGLSIVPPETAPTEKISSNRILGTLPEFDAMRLMPHLDFVSLSAGEEIYRAGEDRLYIYFPETAVISEVYDSVDGNVIETAMTGSEGVTGLSEVLGSDSFPRRSLATIGGNAWRLTTGTFKQEFARSEKLRALAHDCLNRHIEQLTQRLICKSFHVIEKRLCSWLLMLCDRVKNNRLTLTQENTALLLGVNRPTITIAAQTLRNKGLINYSRGGISILNRQGLETSACECYFTLKNKWTSC